MLGTTVVFVHGFTSNTECWTPFLKRLNADADIVSQGFRFLRYAYPTKFLELSVTKRIPDIGECGDGLGDYIENEAPDGPLMLVGHSMGGLVIQSYLAGKITNLRGQDLERIRSVILFATPNRGATILSNVRNIFSWLRENEQESELRVLDEKAADTSAIIVRSLLDAKCVDKFCCPIPFRVFWGMQDDVVPEVSARGPFVEASPLPGGHSEILTPDPNDPRDQRYIALKNALLNPVGHPAIYEIARFEVNLRVTPTAPESAIVLRATTIPIDIHTDNVAVRDIRVAFSKQNRCTIPYEQTYRSIEGWVEILSYDGVNEAAEETMSEYLSTGRRYTYLFTPDNGQTYGMKLKIYNGFGAGERNWHNHMKEDARYKVFSFSLNLKDYRDAGLVLSSEPTLYFHPHKLFDPQLETLHDPDEIVVPLPGTDSWQRTWEIANVHGGVIEVVWDVKKPA